MNVLARQTEPTINTLKFKPRRKVLSHRLPFVDKPLQPKEYSGISFWAVPATGGFGGGNHTGAALAIIYLKSLQEPGRKGGGMLQQIALDMLSHQHDDPDQSLSQRGQAVGFFTQIEEWLVDAVTHMAPSLDALDTKSLLATANKGLMPESDTPY